MAKQIIDARVRQKVGTEAEWLANDLTLLDGEAAVVRTGDGTPVNLKFGDGNKKFSELPYFIQYDQAAYISYTASPAQDVAYTIVGEGTYGSITVDSGKLAVLGWNGSAWSENVLVDLPMQEGTDTLEDEEIPKGKAVAGYVNSTSVLPDDVGLTKIQEFDNVIEYLQSSDINDLDVWGVGYLNKNSGAINSETSYSYLKRYIPVKAGVSYQAKFAQTTNNAGYVLYNEYKEYVSGGNAPNSTTNIITPTVDGFIRFSIARSLGVSNLQLTPETTYIDPSEVSDDVFMTTQNMLNYKSEILKDVGFITTATGTNFVPILTNTDFDDEEEWASGYLNNSGNVIADALRMHSVKYFPLPKGKYLTNMYLSGNVSAVLYNADMTVYSALQEIGSTDGGVVKLFYVPNDGMSIRVTKGLGSESVDTYVSNLEPIIKPSNSVFFQKGVDEVLDAETVGFITIPEGTNIFPFVDPINFSDEDEWGIGFLISSGSVSGQSAWRYTKKFHPIKKGSYRSNLAVSGSAASILYNEDLTIHTVFLDTGAEYNIEVPLNGMRIRFSQPTGANGISRYVSTTESKIVPTSSVFVTPDSLEKSVKEISISTTKDRYGAKKIKPVAVFIADDGHVSCNEWFGDLFRARNCFATLAIIGNRLNSSTNWLNYDQVRAMYDEGFDIANHTYLHQQGLTEEEYEDNVADGRLILNQIGIDCPVIVSPYGEGDFRLNIFRKYHTCNFISASSSLPADQLVNYPPLDTFKIKRVSFDVGNNTGTYLPKCKEVIDYAHTNGGMVAFAVHPNYDEYRESTNPDGYLQRRAELAELLDYIQAYNIPILTARQSMNYYGNLLELGMKNADGTPYYLLGMNKSEENGGYF